MLPTALDASASATIAPRTGKLLDRDVNRPAGNLPLERPQFRHQTTLFPSQVLMAAARQPRL